jgi:ketosteroid isomerase-like protein
MNFFFEHQWIWIVLAGIIFVIGYSTFLNNKQNKTLFLTIAAAMIVLVGGLALEHFIITDKEAIRRTLRDISAAIRADNLEKVKSFTTPDAFVLRDVATRGMAQAKLTTVNFTNVNIKINDATSPVTAELSFTVFFRGRLKGHSLFGDGEFFDRYSFIALFEKNGDQWLATDNVKYDQRFPISH